jgi:hypothetical protein
MYGDSLQLSIGRRRNGFDVGSVTDDDDEAALGCCYRSHGDSDEGRSLRGGGGGSANSL